MSFFKIQFIQNLQRIIYQGLLFIINKNAKLFRLEYPQKIQEYIYGLQDLLHQGTISKIFRGINQKTQQAVAIKVFSRKQLINRQREYIATNNVNGKVEFNNCSNVVRCYNNLSTNNNYYAILQFCNEGNLQNMLSKKKKLIELEAIPIFRDIVSGFRSFVQRKYLHRNLRPSNILFKDKVAKISDFSFMKKQSLDNHDKEQLNTPQYRSYQALTENNYSYKNDIWAIGLILFQMLHGRLPWTRKQCTKQEHIKQIKVTDINYKMQKNLSEDLKDFILKCLKINQKERLNPAQFFNHPFILRIFEEIK